MDKRWIMWVVAVITACISAAAQADSQEERIARLEAQLAAMQQELALLKQQAATQPAQQQAVIQQTTPVSVQTPPSSATITAADEDAINAAVARAMEKHIAETPKLPEWINNVRFTGDFRYRYEWTDDETQTADRNRNRIQARIALYGKVNEDMDFGFRLSSGNSEAPLNEGSPTSNNQDLDNAFSSKNIWMDLAYADYHPRAVPGLNIYGGKMPNPYYRVGDSDLLMDTDVTPEGIAAVYKTPLSEQTQLFGAAGGFYVQERQTEADTSLWGVQGGLVAALNEQKTLQLAAGAGYYKYGNISGEEGMGSDEQEFYGNTTTGPDGSEVYASDFDLVQGFTELTVPAGKLPLRFFGDYICNTQADAQRNTAYLVGTALGKTSAPGSWSIGYNYRDVEADALLGVLAEATFGGGGTDIKGHKFSFNYQLAKNVGIGAAYMMAERTRGGQTGDFDVVTADFTIKF